jgi:DeoR/GlpR family transcriptional regulator of sugar metabolism
MANRGSEFEVEQRRQRVLEYVIEQGEARIGELTERFEVSPMTVHRDLDDLVARRLLRKLRGRAVAPTLLMETSKRFREGLNLPAKEALCARAAERLAGQQTIFMDDSTTLFPLARRMVELTGLTVITNSLEIARIMGKNPDNNTVQLLGGRYTDFDSCIGPDTIVGLKRLHADIGFVSAAAISNGRLFHSDREYAELKTTALGCCEQNVLIADESKFGKAATYCYGGADHYDLVVVQDSTPEAELEALRSLAVPVWSVGRTQPSGEHHG